MVDRPRVGAIALAGGAEFLPAMEDADNVLLGLLGGVPRVVILPTAAATQNARMAARNGLKYFRRLGAKSDAVMIVDHGSANDPDMVAMLSDADMIYLCGGSPAHLLSALKGSSALDALLRLHQEGLAIAGSSAGAMALCERMHAPGDGAYWEDALALVNGIAVLPHFNRATPERINEMLESSPNGILLCGIDEGTAAIYQAGEWRVAGRGEVTILSRDRKRSYGNGQSFQI